MLSNPNAMSESESEFEHDLNIFVCIEISCFNNNVHRTDESSHKMLISMDMYDETENNNNERE